MSRVEEIERAIEALDPKDLAELRRWFLDFDNAIWDAQIEADATEGRLDSMAREARAKHDRGEAGEL